MEKKRKSFYPVYRICKLNHGDIILNIYNIIISPRLNVDKILRRPRYFISCVLGVYSLVLTNAYFQLYSLYGIGYSTIAIHRFSTEQMFGRFRETPSKTSVTVFTFSKLKVFNFAKSELHCRCVSSMEIFRNSQNSHSEEHLWTAASE